MSSKPGAGQQDVLRVVDDQWGCPTATIDLVEAILAIAPPLIAKNPVVGTYHFAGPYAATWYEFAQEIVSAAAPYVGRRPEVVPIKSQEYPSRAARPSNCELDSSKFASSFGFRAADWRRRTHETVEVLQRLDAI